MWHDNTMLNYDLNYWDSEHPRQIYFNKTMANMFPLHNAVFMRDIKKIDTLISQGYNINTNTPNGVTPLYIAVHNNFQAAVDLLLNRGADVCVESELGYSLVYEAIVNKNLLILTKIINNCERAIHIAYNNYSPLCWAIFGNFECGIDFLLEKGANVNFESVNGNTCIFHAVQRFVSTKILSALIERGANLDHRNKRGRTVLHLAVVMNAEIIVKLLLDAGARLDILDYDDKSPLDLALSVGKQRALYVIKCHIVALQLANIRMKLTSYVELSNLSSFHESCKKELEMMKLKKINKFLLLDVFYKYKDPVFIFNSELKETVKLKNLESEYPIYAPLLRLTFKKAQYRFKYLNHLSKYFDVPLPEEIKRYIMSFLNDDELKFLFDEYN